MPVFLNDYFGHRKIKNKDASILSLNKAILFNNKISYLNRNKKLSTYLINYHSKIRASFFFKRRKLLNGIFFNDNETKYFLTEILTAIDLVDFASNNDTNILLLNLDQVKEILSKEASNFDFDVDLSLIINVLNKNIPYKALSDILCILDKIFRRSDHNISKIIDPVYLFKNFISILIRIIVAKDLPKELKRNGVKVLETISLYSKEKRKFLFNCGLMSALCFIIREICQEQQQSRSSDQQTIFLLRCTLSCVKSLAQDFHSNNRAYLREILASIHLVFPFLIYNYT